MWSLLVQSLAMSVLTAPAPCSPHASAPATPLRYTTLDVYNEGEYVRDVTVLLEWYKYARGARASAAPAADGGAATDADPVLIHKTEFRAWKRNSDLINSLLSLPKSLIHSGRK